MLPCLHTELLTPADVSRHTEALLLLHELREALIDLTPQHPPANPLLREATHPSVPVRSVTVDGPGRALLQLYDLATGKLLAVIDAEALSSLRASLVAALAVDVLAAPEAKRVAVLGGGPRGSGALKALRLVRSLREVWLVTPELEQTVLEAAQLQHALKTPVRPAERAVDAVANADVVLLTGGVSLPEVALWPSVHLSVLRTQSFAAAPLTAGVMAKAWRVSDGPGSIWSQPVQAALGAVLAGRATRPPGANTLFLGAGPPWLDLLVAWHVYQGARSDEALTRPDFEA
jgi:ornithine cyclodeaminase